jgi:hypothetical protein
VWILLDGIVAAHVAVPGVPAFEAAVEARPLFPRGAPLPPPSALREAVEPFLEKLTARALDCVLRAAKDIDRLPGASHARVREWVLAAARKKLRTPEMRSAPVFRAIASRGAEEKRLSIDGLESLAAGARSLVALFPDQEPAKFLLPPLAVPVLDATERGRLSALIGVSFRPPPPRRTEGGALARLRAGIASLRHSASDLIARLTHPFEGRPIAEASLGPGERAFLATVREHVMTEACDELDVRFVEGAGPIRHFLRPRPSLHLPRRNPVVAAALATLTRDEAWIYPVALALEALPRPATRSTFLRR